MTNEKLDQYMDVSMDIQSVFDLIEMCSKWITIGDIEFCTSKYAELIDGEAIGIIFDPDDDANILIKTMKGNFIPIHRSLFLHMINNCYSANVESTIKNLMEQEYYDETSELTKLEERMLEISNNIKNQKAELERLIDKKHKLTNQWQQKNH